MPIQTFPGDIVATRNKLIHGYFTINNELLWSIIQTDIPELIPQLQQLIKTIE